MLAWVASVFQIVGSLEKLEKSNIVDPGQVSIQDTAHLGLGQSRCRYEGMAELRGVSQVLQVVGRADDLVVGNWRVSSALRTYCVLTDSVGVLICADIDGPQ